MRAKPILFSDSMVRAILDRRKTQTRRLVKYIPAMGEPYDWCHKIKDDPAILSHIVGDYTRYAPYQCGGHLWVREAFQVIHVSIDPETGYGDDINVAPAIPSNNRGGYWGIAYRATEPHESREDRGFAWRQSIFMPRWASRLTLEVTDVRVDRLQAISEADAVAEGVGNIAEYADLWDAINGTGAWQRNPWVWVYNFKRISDANQRYD